ncbi:hypothetical protein Tco_1053982 [Tanacetum coccineum]|uniref:Xylulose kinase-1 n=1 Tax=Tanacetum coccineum TaxID=301880 RepID=A0ABQ5GVH0_9ASTR
MIIWAMKMEHYITHTDYPLWQIILNGNCPKKISTDTNGIIRVLPPKSAEDFLAIERERKARTTLVMALPEDHFYGFHNISDAKEIWDAIKSRTRTGLDTLSFDDLYNNLKVFKSDVKGSGGSSSSAHNVAFVGSECTTSTKDSHVLAFMVPFYSSGQHTHKESSSSYVDEVDKKEIRRDGLKMADGLDFRRVNPSLQEDKEEAKFQEKATVWFCKSVGYNAYKAKKGGKNQAEPKALAAVDGGWWRDGLDVDWRMNVGIGSIDDGDEMKLNYDGGWGWVNGWECVMNDEWGRSNVLEKMNDCVNEWMGGNVMLGRMNGVRMKKWNACEELKICGNLEENCLVWNYGGDGMLKFENGVKLR